MRLLVIHADNLYWVLDQWHFIFGVNRLKVKVTAPIRKHISFRKVLVLIITIVILQNVRECFKVCEEHENALRWAVTVWSDCGLRPEFRECSIKNGLRHRNVTCVWRENGRVEDDSVCSEFEPKPDTHEICDLKCPQDCVVSLFSSWNVKNCDNCLIINKTRTRELIIPPANDGFQCPPFTEMIPCDNCTNVYTYKIGAWDNCTPYSVTSNIRGQVHPQIGYQKRTILCINTYGSIVLYKWVTLFKV